MPPAYKSRNETCFLLVLPGTVAAPSASVEKSNIYYSLENIDRLQPIDTKKNDLTTDYLKEGLEEGLLIGTGKIGEILNQFSGKKNY